MSVYDLPKVAAAYASDVVEKLPAALSYGGLLGGNSEENAVAVNLACGGLRVDVYGTYARGVVVASFGDEIAACRVPSDVWSVAWDMLAELSPRPY